ncbi:alpha/beta hydrolase [Streptomyces sp. NPDC051940]|uniref:alpha/beta fold hydrolase n=1 Tax=Streptomyces sp. NPDC051940 TaxID=3155675 RepID=UPI00342DD409
MTEYLDVAEGRIAYDVTGEGPLIVMAPGMGDLRQSYRLLVPELVAAGYRVATFDIRGHGESSTGWDSYTTTAVGSDYAALIRHLGGPATVVGLSWTPDSAVVAAAELPEEVTGVVLLSTWATAPQPGALMAALQRLVVRTPALWAMFYRSLYKGPKPADFKDYVKALKANLREPGRTASFVAVALPESKDSGAYRARVHQPALIVMGDKDPDFDDPRAEAEKYASDLAGSTEIVLIADAGHYPQAERPAEVAAAMLPFLARTAGAAGA